MKETLVSFETAKLAKEKGFKFDETLDFYHEGYHGLFHWHTDKDKITCMSFFENDSTNTGWFYMNIEVPTQSLLQKWLRESHGIHVTSISQYNTNRQFQHYYVTVNGKAVDELEFNTYEEALEKGLQEALKLIK